MGNHDSYSDKFDVRGSFAVVGLRSSVLGRERSELRSLSSIRDPRAARMPVRRAPEFLEI